MMFIHVYNNYVSLSQESFVHALGTHIDETKANVFMSCAILNVYSLNEDFEYGYPILMHKKHFYLKKTVKRSMLCQHPVAASCIKPLAFCFKPLVIQWKGTLHNDVEFATVYCRINCNKFMTLSNRTSRYICKCIRMAFSVIINLENTGCYDCQFSPIDWLFVLIERKSEHRWSSL